MAELEDLSGPFKPDLRFDDLSKPFLLRIMEEWQYAWLTLSGSWYESVKKRYGSEVANACEVESWVDMAGKVNPRYPKLANIEIKTVLDSLKAAQLPLDNTTQTGLFPATYEIISPNHVILTVQHCVTLRFMEKKAPERIPHVCHVLEKPCMEKYFLNPRLKVTPLKLPPRQSPDDIACQWDLSLED